jgi:hypothetical protein
MLSESAEHLLTYTHTVVFRFCQLENINYLVLRYHNTGAVPFEEFSKELLVEGEIQVSHISETVVGTALIWKG